MVVLLACVRDSHSPAPGDTGSALAPLTRPELEGAHRSARPSLAPVPPPPPSSRRARVRAYQLVKITLVGINVSLIVRGAYTSKPAKALDATLLVMVILSIAINIGAFYGVWTRGVLTVYLVRAGAAGLTRPAAVRHMPPSPFDAASYGRPCA